MKVNKINTCEYPTKARRPLNSKMSKKKLKNMGFTVGAFASGSTFTKFMKGANLIKTGLGAATAGSIYGAINEARVEANHNSTDFYKKEQCIQVFIFCIVLRES